MAMAVATFWKGISDKLRTLFSTFVWATRCVDVTKFIQTRWRRSPFPGYNSDCNLHGANCMGGVHGSMALFLGWSIQHFRNF